MSESINQGRVAEVGDGIAAVDALMLGDVAMVAHEANRAYCIALGDFTQPRWEDAPEWQKTSARNGVEAIHSGHVTTPEDSHKSWGAEKIVAGWTYGITKNPDLKQHPCLVPYALLPPEQQVKDALFFAIVRTLIASRTNR